MTQRTKAIDTLKEYFDKKGRVLTAQEYVREKDTPIRFQIVKNMFGGWGRMEKIVMARDNNNGAITDVDEVIRLRNEKQLAFEQQWKDASENQEAKMKREQEAKKVAEKNARMAATPEGANAYKIAVGGPLPSEQPKLERVGGTVNIDPVTLERTVVDVQPEKVLEDLKEETEAEDADKIGKTQEEIKAEVEPKTGSVKTGTATSGEAKGTPSVGAAAKAGA